jgi:16S rRNA U516 pseudouridylate synthase RsuA-like enzyme
MCEALGYKVTILTRTRIMHIPLRGIAPGTWRYFTDVEKKQLEDLIRNSSKTESNIEFDD